MNLKRCIYKKYHLVKTSAHGFALCVCLFAASVASADCTTAMMGLKPDGHIFYNADFKLLQYCDGTDWIPMHVPGSGSGGCNTVTMGVKPEGHIFYNKDRRVMQGCAGTQWMAMGPVGGTGGDAPLDKRAAIS